jgi:hypothetical protein
MTLPLRIACHEFDNDNLDTRCTLTHSQCGDTERCPMTLGWLCDAPPEDIGRQAPDIRWCGHGQFQQSEYDAIQKYKERKRAAWLAVVGVCSH